METKTENKEQQWNDSISQSSSSRSSSITSDSSDGHFDIRHFPLPKPSLSASEAQKQREIHQAYNSSLSSYTGSSWSFIHQNHLLDSPGYDPNRIPSLVFSSKPANSTEWSIASNESLFSIHDRNFTIPTREDHGLAAALRLAEIPKFENPVLEIIEINQVPLPPINKPTAPEKETITGKKPDQVEKSDSVTDDDDDDKIKEEEMTELKSEDEHEEEEEEELVEAEIIVQTETEKQQEKEVVEDVKDNKPEDANSTASHSPSISCHSDTSNNSVCSFAFPLLQKEDGVNNTPSMEIRGNVSHKRRPEYLRPQSLMQPAQPKQLPYSESCTPTQLQPQSQPQRKASKKIESRTQSPKASRNGRFSCFHCSLKCGLFK